MNQRVKLGKTGMEIFPVILGSVSAGQDMDQKTTNGLIDHYLDLGGNCLDTARVYTDGRSEEAIGNWFQSSGRRNDVVLMTKGGHPRMQTMHTPRMCEADMRSDIEDSLRALKTDYIDIYFYHRDSLAQSVAESLEIMEKFVKEGKIRSYGCSNWTSARIQEAIDYSKAHGLQGFCANQMLFNIGSKYMKPFPDDTMCAMDEQMKQIHTVSDIMSVPYFGVCSGFFYTLKAKGEEAVKNSPYYTPGNLAMAKRIYELAEAHHTTVTAILLKFFFVQPFPNCPLYGTTKIERLKDLESLFDLKLTAEDYNV